MRLPQNFVRLAGKPSRPWRASMIFGRNPRTCLTVVTGRFVRFFATSPDHVFGPTMPSAVTPAQCCATIVAFSVFAPNSTLTGRALPDCRYVHGRCSSRRRASPASGASARCGRPLPRSRFGSGRCPRSAQELCERLLHFGVGRGALRELRHEGRPRVGGRGVGGCLLVSRGLVEGALLDLVVGERDERSVGRGRGEDVVCVLHELAGALERLHPCRRALTRPPGGSRGRPCGIPRRSPGRGHPSRSSR
jgi:hypothetical protein